MQVLRELIDILEAIAPTRHAESWDNVGLIVGDPAQDVSRVMLTIDYTAEVAREAAEAKCDLVIAYHPPIFEGLKRVVAGGSTELMFDAIRRGVAIYSPHTAIDVAEGGTNDMLADALGLGDDRVPLKLIDAKASQYKLVTFVPEDDVEKVSSALFDSGAGRIGNYERCSFQGPGTGTFFGKGGTKPAVGLSGRLERLPEVRLETVVPIARVTQVLAALRQAHPYEEPAFDLVQLAVPPEKLGQGRIGTLKSPTSRSEIFERIKRELDLQHLLIAGPTEGEVSRVACCAGACGNLLNDALAAKVELYLTGEMRHHDAIKAAARGVTVVCTLHSNSERAMLKRLKSRLEKETPSVSFVLSKQDADPFTIR